MKKILNRIFCGMVILLPLFSSGCASDQDSPDEQVTDETQNTETKIENQEKIDTRQQISEDVDLSDLFNGISGCALIYDTENGKYSVYNDEMCNQEVSPYSTFKIITTLTGLKNGILMDEYSAMDYNGTQYPLEEWNRELNLKEAFQSSCIWYFKQVIDAVGEDEVKEEIDNIEYGNCDISEWDGSGINSLEELNGFWLDSSLKISPYEQVEVLRKIFEGKSIYEDSEIETLKKVMLMDGTEEQALYGKTGSGTNGEAWFVGFLEEEDNKKYFAIYLDDYENKDSISGSVAKEIAIKIMKQMSSAGDK